MTSAQNTPTPSVTRGTFLRSAAVLTGGMAGFGALAAADAAPQGAEPHGTSSNPHKIPKSWRETIMDAPLLLEPRGYLAAFTSLYGEGPVKSLSAKRVEGLLSGEAGFMPYGVVEQTEEFTPSVAGPVALDKERVNVTFTGSTGFALAADVQLVRTADINTHALLLWVRGFEPALNLVPKKTTIAVGHFPGKSHQQVSRKAAAEELVNAVALCFAEEGSFPVKAHSVTKADDGTISGRVTGTYDGMDFDDTWFGVPVPGDGGVGYVFAARP